MNKNHFQSLILCADAHLRDMQFGRRDRGRDFQKALLHIVNQAIKTNSPILFGGDLLDTTRPSPWTMAFLLSLHRKLAAAGVPMYVVNGNHDFTEPSWIDVVQEEAEVDIIGGIKLIDNKLVKIPGTTVSVYGVPSIRKEEFLAKRSEWPEADILLCHQPIKEFCEFPMETALTFDQLPSRYKMIVVGDIHVTDEKLTPAGVRVVSPGSTELCQKSESAEKSFFLLPIKGGELGTLEKQVIPTRRVLCLRVVTEEDMPEVLAKVSDAAPANPMVFVRYNTHIANVVGRLHAVIDPDKAILRAAPFVTEGEEVFTDDSPQDDRKMEDFLDLFLTPGTGLFKTASLIMQPGSRAVDILDAYVEERMALLDAPAAPEE